MTESPEGTRGHEAPSSKEAEVSRTAAEKAGLKQSEREAAVLFFETKTLDWPRDAMQRRMQSSGG